MQDIIESVENDSFRMTKKDNFLERFVSIKWNSSTVPCDPFVSTLLLFIYFVIITERHVILNALLPTSESYREN